jgi:hypothetical protein
MAINAGGRSLRGCSMPLIKPAIGRVPLLELRRADVVGMLTDHCGDGGSVENDASDTAAFG